MVEEAVCVVRIPKRFMIDHMERDLPSPTIVRETKANYFVHAAGPEFDELVSDARHYADPTATDCEPWLRLAARALLVALGKPLTAR